MGPIFQPKQMTIDRFEGDSHLAIQMGIGGVTERKVDEWHYIRRGDQIIHTGGNGSFCWRREDMLPKDRGQLDRFLELLRANEARAIREHLGITIGSIYTELIVNRKGYEVIKSLISAPKCPYYEEGYEDENVFTLELRGMRDISFPVTIEMAETAAEFRDRLRDLRVDFRPFGPRIKVTQEAEKA